ncbi:MAG: Stp1/IreP family PP2C-type Ser/Thr phosphatase [Streptococcaceae bacterium]|jgi:protein phosphatase|nr:Stp1/IreP family PP2C-type Ser/Thr phosphatase [Streptococcaceae bacterium]
MKISFLSDIGKIRSTNQDYTQVFYNQKKSALVLLADGMGGHKAGDLASQMTVKTLGVKWEKTDFSITEEVVQWFLKEIQALNEAVHEKGLNEKFLGMGTTLEAVAIFAGTYIIAHVGDSRSYALREGEIVQLTQDHSLVNDLFLAGEITAKEAYNHPQKNIITRSIGMPHKIDIDVVTQNFLPRDYLLLSSDGLTNMVSNEEILKIVMKNKTIEEKVEKLVTLANEHGGKDNVTVSLIYFEEEDLND